MVYENWKVLGHICTGMKEHQDYSTYMCIPVINRDGFIAGCDDVNTVQIRYCPFCGTKLVENKIVNFK